MSQPPTARQPCRVCRCLPAAPLVMASCTTRATLPMLLPCRICPTSAKKFACTICTFCTRSGSSAKPARIAGFDGLAGLPCACQKQERADADRAGHAAVGVGRPPGGSCGRAGMRVPPPRPAQLPGAAAGAAGAAGARAAARAAAPAPGCLLGRHRHAVAVSKAEGRLGHLSAHSHAELLG